MLDEYALCFYTLLEQSVKMDAVEWRMAANAATFPHLDQQDREKMSSTYEDMSSDIIEHLREGKANPSVKELKQVMQGK